MKLHIDYIDIFYDFKGLWDCPSSCGLKIFRGIDRDVIIATELYTENPGTSITNGCTLLAGQIIKEFNLLPERLFFIEHTPDQESKMDFYNETFFRIIMEWNGVEFTNPKWEEISKEEVNTLLG